jgi:alkylated DNA nucleotide flippase Atl1
VPRRIAADATSGSPATAAALGPVAAPARADAAVFAAVADDAELSERAREVLDRVAAIPEGFVRTYGDVSPGAPRFSGSVLAAYGDRVPWHRVVRADGSLAQGERQRALLDAEGVPMAGARVDLRVARLPPDVDPA